MDGLLDKYSWDSSADHGDVGFPTKSGTPSEVGAARIPIRSRALAPTLDMI